MAGLCNSPPEFGWTLEWTPEHGDWFVNAVCPESCGKCGEGGGERRLGSLHPTIARRRLGDDDKDKGGGGCFVCDALNTRPSADRKCPLARRR